MKVPTKQLKCCLGSLQQGLVGRDPEIPSTEYRLQSLSSIKGRLSKIWLHLSWWWWDRLENCTETCTALRLRVETSLRCKWRSEIASTSTVKKMDPLLRRRSLHSLCGTFIWLRVKRSSTYRCGTKWYWTAAMSLESMALIKRGETRRVVAPSKRLSRGSGVELGLITIEIFGGE